MRWWEIWSPPKGFSIAPAMPVTTATWSPRSYTSVPVRSKVPGL